MTWGASMTNIFNVTFLKVIQYLNKELQFRARQSRQIQVHFAEKHFKHNQCSPHYLIISDQVYKTFREKVITWWNNSNTDIRCHGNSSIITGTEFSDKENQYFNLGNNSIGKMCSCSQQTKPNTSKSTMTFIHHWLTNYMNKTSEVIEMSNCCFVKLFMLIYPKQTFQSQSTIQCTV